MVRRRVRQLHRDPGGVRPLPLQEGVAVEVAVPPLEVLEGDREELDPPRVGAEPVVEPRLQRHGQREPAEGGMARWTQRKAQRFAYFSTVPS